MKKIFLLLFALFLIKAVTAQIDSAYVTEMSVEIQSSLFDRSKSIVDNFIKTSSVKVITFRESEDRIYLDFFIDRKGFYQLDSLLEKLGYIAKKEIKTTNNIDNINKLNLEINYLENRKKEYEKELNSITEKNNLYYEYWEEVRKIERDLFELSKKSQYYSAENLYSVEITVFDDIYDMYDRSIDWVNMPGGMFEMLWIENPVSNISASQYQGYALKYLFTKGKSYGILGALKAVGVGDDKDSTMIEEIFIFGFGQDWYTKHFGRGKNKFFNLYTGVNAGGLFVTGDARKRTIFYSKIFLGLELFKNQYILLDNQVGYFVPFYYNRNLRGVYYNASFNFVF